MAKYVPEEERFLAMIEETQSGCWEWRGYKNSKGYGMFHPYQRRGNVFAHRWAYEKYVGVVPDGLVLDHLCENKSCANPEHLEPVTNAENLRRGGVGQKNAEHHKSRTHCRNGHEYTEETTGYVRRKSRGVLTRHCLLCYDKRSSDNQPLTK